MRVAGTAGKQRATLECQRRELRGRLRCLVPDQRSARISWPPPPATHALRPGSSLRSSLRQILQGRRLARQQPRPPGASRALRSGRPGLVEPVQPQVDGAEVVQRVPFGVSADFPGDIAGLDVALRGRVRVAAPEVDLTEVVQRDAAQRDRARGSSRSTASRMYRSASSPGPSMLRCPSPSPMRSAPLPPCRRARAGSPAPAPGGRRPPRRAAWPARSRAG